MQDNPYLAPGTKLGDEYRRNLDRVELNHYQHPEPPKLGLFRGITGLVLFMLALGVAWIGGGVILYAVGRSNWGQAGMGLGMWGIGVVLALVAFFMTRRRG